MSRIIKTAKLLRRNWKKSTFFFGVLAYGTSYLVERYKTFQMMRAYCEEARKYGEKPLSQTTKPKHITVILNPEANNKKCNVQFEKFAAPLLHLAGFKVSVFQTEKEKQAQELMEVMSNTDAVLVAGGDGTLQEAVTGLLRRPQPNEDENLPLGIVPLGKTNTVARYLFHSQSSSNAQLVAEAVMAVIRETTVKLDVLKVQYTDETHPVFAMFSFEQGIFADVERLVQKYWYFGALKDKFTYFINSTKEWKSTEVDKLEYVFPCGGCSKCFVPSKTKEKVEYGKRWWQAFVPKIRNSDSQSISDKERQLATRVNENCGKRAELPSAYSNLSISTISADLKSKDQPNSLWVKLFPKELSMTQFISCGLSHRQSKNSDYTGNASIVNAQEVIIETTRSQKISPASLEQPAIPISDDSYHTEQTVSNVTEQIAPSLSDQIHQNTIAVSNQSESTSLNETNSVSQSPDTGLMAHNSSGKESSDADSTDSDTSVNENEPLSSIQEETKGKNSTNQPLYTYIDNEIYKRGSCTISLLPKQVTIYG